jgi:hypothetical protein
MSMTDQKRKKMQAGRDDSDGERRQTPNAERQTPNAFPQRVNRRIVQEV